MMMDCLFKLNNGKFKLSDLKNSLTNWDDGEVLTEIAPASGLVLHKTSIGV